MIKIIGLPTIGSKYLQEIRSIGYCQLFVIDNNSMEGQEIEALFIVHLITLDTQQSQSTRFDFLEMDRSQSYFFIWWDEPVRQYLCQMYYHLAVWRFIGSDLGDS